MLNSLCGNNELKQSLLAALSGGRLSHSVLICGEDGAGVNYAARCLAADYLYPDNGPQAAAIMRGEGAECITICGEGASGDIKIDAVRSVRREIYNTAISAGGRVVLFRGANKLNGPSANAVLKVLEEPPENVLFILTAPSEAAVLATIRSRCSVYTVCAPSKEECEEFLIKEGAEKQTAQKLSSVFSGRIGLAKRVLENESEAAVFKSAEELYLSYKNRDELKAAALLAAYEKDKPAVQSLFAYTRILISGDLHDNESSRRCSGALCAIYEASQQLSRNGLTKLVLTVAAAKICE